MFANSDGSVVSEHRTGSSLNAPPTKPEERCWTLYQPRDSGFLSEQVCFTRMQLEVFVATPSDLRNRTERACIRDKVSVGSVGLRCVHCSSGRRRDILPQYVERRASCATVYPGKIEAVYEAVRNWQSRHFKACKKVPPEVRAEFDRLKAMGKRKRVGGSNYWEEACRLMGLVDTESGIRLQSGGPFIHRKIEPDGQGQACNGAATRMATEAGDGNLERIITKKRRVMMQQNVPAKSAFLQAGANACHPQPSMTARPEIEKERRVLPQEVASQTVLQQASSSKEHMAYARGPVQRRRHDPAAKNVAQHNNSSKDHRADARGGGQWGSYDLVAKNVAQQASSSKEHRADVRVRKNWGRHDLVANMAQHASSHEDLRAGAHGPMTGMTAHPEFMYPRTNSQVITARTSATDSARSAQRPVQLAMEWKQRQASLQGKPGPLSPLPPISRQDQFSHPQPCHPPLPVASASSEYEYEVKYVMMPVAVLKKKQKQRLPEGPGIVPVPAEPKDAPGNAESGGKLSLLVQAMDSVEAMS